MDELTLWKSRHDSLLTYYRELQSLYEQATGVHFIPADLLTKAAITDEDREWLRSLGISVEVMTDSSTPGE